MRKLRAAVVGLGQVGSRFDEEPRGAVWSHTGAYLALPDSFDLVAGVDPDAGCRERFAARCPSAKVLSNVAELAALEVDAVSVATHPSQRVEVFRSLLSATHPPKVIVCEKPLAVDSASRTLLLDMCNAASVVLLVHYNRRYMNIYRRFSVALREGLIGEVTSISVRMPNRLWSMGSHALDTLLYLSGEVPVSGTVLPLPNLEEGGEPAGDYLCIFPSGAAGRLLTQGRKQVLIFEVDAIGTAGRLVTRNYGDILEYYSFDESSRYMGYLEGKRRKILYRTRPGESSFVEVAKEAAQVARGMRNLTCSGAMASTTEELLNRIIEAAKASNHH